MNETRLIGSGRTAEVYAVDASRVVKVMRPGFEAATLEIEAHNTQAVHDAGVAAPGTHGGMVVVGRPGHLFDRIDGPIMLDRLRRRPWRYRGHADLLAALHADMHARQARDLPIAKERLRGAIEAAPSLDTSMRRAAITQLQHLGDGDRILHGDFHPGNVVLGVDRPIIIDWLDATAGSPAADVARTLWLLSPATIQPGTPLRRPLSRFIDAFRRRYLRCYLAITGLDPARVDAWRLPVLAARLAEGIPHEIGPLQAEIGRLTAA